MAIGHEVVVSSFDDSSDSDLWQQATERDGAAFGLLFRRHGRTVYNHCFRRTASWAEAEDLTSTVFLEAWRRRRDVRFYSESVLPWLLAVANNMMRNAGRAKRRHQRFLTKLPEPPEVTDFVDDLAHRVDDERAMAGILAAISHLRIEEQEAIALCDWAGLSYDAAANALGVPVGTIRSRLSRAHHRLRDRRANSVDGCAPPFPVLGTLTLEEQ